MSNQDDAANLIQIEADRKCNYDAIQGISHVKDHSYYRSYAVNKLRDEGKIVWGRCGAWVTPTDYVAQSRTSPVEADKAQQDTRFEEALLKLQTHKRLNIHTVGERGISVQDRHTATQVTYMQERSQHRNRQVALRALINILIAENLL